MTQPVAFNGGHGVKCVTRCSFLIARLLVDRGCPLWSRTARDAITRGTRVGAVEGAFDGQRGGHNATVYRRRIINVITLGSLLFDLLANLCMSLTPPATLRHHQSTRDDPSFPNQCRWGHNSFRSPFATMFPPRPEST